MDSVCFMKARTGTYSIPEIGKMLGLCKTESYWLVEHRDFETVVVRGHTRVLKESFESWYENQIKYKKVDGTPPGRKLREKSFSVDELAEALAVSTSTIYELIKRKCFDTFLVDSWMRIPKDSFQAWYCSQEVYRTAEDRKEDEKLRAISYSMPDIRKMLGIHRNCVYSLLDHHKTELEFLFVAGQKRVTKASFDAWLASHGRYTKVVIEPIVPQQSIPEVIETPAQSIPEEKPVYRIEEVQAILNLSRKAIYKRIQDGRMIAMKAGNTYWVPAKEVEKQKEGK